MLLDGPKVRDALEAVYVVPAERVGQSANHLVIVPGTCRRFHCGSNRLGLAV